MGNTIIVGAGINGLLLGALLAHDGETVTIFEKNRFPGGRAFLYERGGYVMDYGIHLVRFGPGSALARILKRIGSEIRFRKPGTSYVIDTNGRRVVFPTSLPDILRSDMFTLYEKARLAGILYRIKKGELNDDGLLDVSLRDWLIRNNITGGPRRYLELLSASVMVCPFIEKTSAGEMFRVLNRIITGGHSAEYPAGGWKPVHAALLSEIGKGGTIRCGETVESVIIQNGKAAGVTAGGRRYAADRVVIAVPAQELFSMVPQGLFSPAYVKKCRQLVPASGIFFDIALDRRIADYDGLLYTVSPMTFGMITSNLAAGLAPEGGQILTMLYPTSVEDVRDGALRIQRKDELWSAIKKFFPDIEQHVLWMRESSLKMLDGVQANTTQTAKDRPGTSVPGIRDLFLAGDSIAAPGAGGDIGYESVCAAYAAMTGTVL